MKIAILSDVHDNVSNLLTALYYAEKQHCTHLLYLGDIAEVSTLHVLLDSWNHPADIVFGNNEYDLRAHTELVQRYPLACHHGDEGTLCLQGRRIYISHYPRKAFIAADCGDYDAAFNGHTHVAEQRQHRQTLVANPGEVGGIRRLPGFGVYDTAINEMSIHPL